MDTFDREWKRWFPENGGRPTPPPPSRRNLTRIILMVVAILIVILVLLNITKGIYTDWLWFSSLGYQTVFATILSTRVTLFFITTIIAALFITVNYLLAIRLTPKQANNPWPFPLANRLRRVTRWGTIGLISIVSIIFGLVAQVNWEIILRFFNRQSFGIIDPIFFKEVGFYIFSLPFFHLIRGWLIALLVLGLLISGGVYLVSYTVQRLRFNYARPVLIHIGIMIIAVLGLIAWGYQLGIWELVFSTRGVVFGASYADIHAKIPSQWILFVTVLLIIVMIPITLWRRRLRWLLYSFGGWVAIIIVVGIIFPAIVQRFQVQPNELARERDYIQNNIQFTREAFALNRIDEQPFPAEESITPEDIAANQVTLSNIRLWDTRPLMDTYEQLHSIRLYYDFNDVDVDRYFIDNQYRQVMLAARELSADKLPTEAQTWVNRKLQFTHGYGVVLSPVNEVTPQGLPVLLIENIPPQGVFDITQPEIYYGEKSNDFIIVNTNTDEFDYPRGDFNIYGQYRGNGGIRLDSFWKRLIYAWQFGDLNILISGELTENSRVLYHRNIQERVTRLAPFLQLDEDPYLVINDGQLHWIQDAYTTSDRYPYSEPTRDGINYIRNSVKVVINAYDGSATFYVTDPDDPLIKAYQAIFPNLFVSQEEVPHSLSMHWRYPVDMFNIQATVYQKYHMRDARVFYNQEDLWDVPQEFYAGSKQPMEPYYIIIRLPIEQSEEFLLMLPFTPVNKNNAISWLAARCDGSNYGKLLVYSFPKDRVIKGPSQIEDRIQQDTVITEQFALWNQGGSRVIRGNLLLIPIGKSVIYVEPVFLQAEAGGLPELKRVIIAAGEQIAMEPTLQESLNQIFATEVTPPIEIDITEPEQESAISPVVLALVQEAQQHFDRAQEFLKAGDWAGYGQELNALKAVLDRLASITAEE